MRRWTAREILFYVAPFLPFLILFGVVILLSCDNSPTIPVTEDLTNTQGMWKRKMHFCTQAWVDTTTGLPIPYARLKFQYQEIGGGYFYQLGEKMIEEDAGCQDLLVSVPNRPINLWVAAIDNRDNVGYWASIRSIPPDIEDWEVPE